MVGGSVGLVNTHVATHGPFSQLLIVFREKKREEEGKGRRKGGEKKRERERAWQVEKRLSGCTTHTPYPVFDALFAFLNI